MIAADSSAATRRIESIAAETLAIADEGKVRADIELEPLASINAIFDRLEHGKVAGRAVLEFATVSNSRPEPAAHPVAVPA